jgi:WD40 repeat protein
MAVVLTELRGHRDSVNSVSVHEHNLASASDDGTVRLWDLRRNL